MVRCLLLLTPIFLICRFLIFIALPCLDLQCANMNFHLFSLHKQNNAAAILAQGDICDRMSEAGIVNNTITVSSDF